MKKLIFAITLLCYVLNSSAAFGMYLVHVLAIRGVNMPISGNPNHCAPIMGICDLQGGDLPVTDYSMPYDLAGFNENGNLVIEFVNYDFENDEWLKGDELLLKGDYIMSDETAGYLGGDPVTIKAGRYRLEYRIEKNTKIVVFK